jgi:hypothetical protein
MHYVWFGESGWLGLGGRTSFCVESGWLGEQETLAPPSCRKQQGDSITFLDNVNIRKGRHALDGFHITETPDRGETEPDKLTT